VVAFTAKNGDAFIHAPGTAVSVALGIDCTVVAASANDADMNVVGFSTETVPPGAVGDYQDAGILDCFSGLTPGAAYFLSATTPGAVTAEAPAADRQVVQRIGTAVSKTKLLIRIAAAIRL